LAYTLTQKVEVIRFLKRLDVSNLYDITTQKTILFIVTAVRICLNLLHLQFHCHCWKEYFSFGLFNDAFNSQVLSSPEHPDGP
jgi:hypothetical protein